MSTLDQDFNRALVAAAPPPAPGDAQIKYLLMNMRKRGKTWIPFEYYNITAGGWVKRLDMPFTPTRQWKILSVRSRINSSFGMPWADVVRLLDAGEKVEGYVIDFDHGGRRGWSTKSSLQKK